MVIQCERLTMLDNYESKENSKPHMISPSGYFNVERKQQMRGQQTLLRDDFESFPFFLPRGMEYLMVSSCTTGRRDKIKYYEKVITLR
jgi:hypothetical protein